MIKFLFLWYILLLRYLVSWIRKFLFKCNFFILFLITFGFSYLIHIHSHYHYYTYVGDAQIFLCTRKEWEKNCRPGLMVIAALIVGCLNLQTRQFSLSWSLTRSVTDLQHSPSRQLYLFKWFFFILFFLFSR